MENEIKPEWFQMADDDRRTQAARTPSRRKRSVAILALSAPLMALGAGLIFAQSTTVASATDSQPTSQIQSPTPGPPSEQSQTLDTQKVDATPAASPTLNLPSVPASVSGNDEDAQNGDVNADDNNADDNNADNENSDD